MKVINIKILSVLIIIGLVPVSKAQLFRSTSKVGTTAAQFLKITPGARAVGMGGALTAIDGDVYSTYYNPAGVARNSNNGQVAFNHASWLADMSYDYAAAALNIQGMGTLFATLTSFRVPEDKVRTFTNPEGDGRFWDAGAIAIGLGFARQLTDRFSIGFQAKFIHESVWNSSSNGFAVDVGTLYETPFNGLKIGAAITNFGTQMQLDGRDIQFNYDPNDDINSGPNNIPATYQTAGFDLPLTFRIGLAMDLVKNRFIRVTGAIDANHPNDNTEYINSGLEVAYDEMFFVRAGYRSLYKDNSEEGLTFGGGLKYKFTNSLKIVLNYGFADFGRLSNVQFFDIGLVF
jgi:opacity protein-like surface antigen